MSRRLAALGAVVYLLAGISIAAADRRPVAVIDLVGEARSDAKAKADQLNNDALRSHPDLATIPKVELAGALVGELPDPDGDHLKEAWSAKTNAEQALASFQFAAATTHVENGQKELRLSTPTVAAVQTYAELAFLLGQARLGERKPADAASAFVLAKRLLPTFAPDPARYLPEIITAYEAANAKPAPVVKLTIGGTGRVWVDGKEIGAAPVEVDAATGIHVIWMTGADRLTKGIQVNVLAEASQKVLISDDPATERVLVQRARARLKFAPDPTARAAAMKHLAELVGVGDAVLLSVDKGKLLVQTWRERAPGFSAIREVRSNELPIKLLEPLAPPPVKVVKPEPEPIKLPRRPVPFYKKRTWQVAMVTGALGVFAGSVLLYQNRDRFFGVDTNPGFKDTEAVR